MTKSEGISKSIFSLILNNKLKLKTLQKIKQMALFFKNERDMDFFNSCEKIRRENNKYISSQDIANKAVLSSAKSFYITCYRCYNIILKIKNNEPFNSRSSAKLALFEEIKKRYLNISKEKPGTKDFEIACEIVSQQAPRFYITKTRAEKLYYDLLKTMR